MRPSAFCHGVLDQKVILEVSIFGRGMIWPSFGTQLIFSLRNDGLVAYDARTKNGLAHRSFQLPADQLARVVSILNTNELADARTKYPMLEDMKDALLETCVNIRANHEKRILIINDQPSHPRGTEYYPKALREVLATAARLRPRTNYEQGHGGGVAGLP